MSSVSPEAGFGKGAKSRARPAGNMRQRKKDTRRREILQAASELFSEHGYTSTSMDAIAQAADISPNTIYNYYRTKGRLLIALISASDESFLAKRRTAGAQPGNALEFMIDFLEALAKHSLAQIDKNTWKHAIAQTMVHDGNEDIGSDIRAINRNLTDLIESIIKELKYKSYFNSSVNPKSLASMLFDFHRVLFIRMVVSENMSWRLYRSILRSYVEAALQGKIGR